MANFSAADVKTLRDLTGAGMLDCKNALQEADGDVDRAVEILRVTGKKGVAKREGRTASNGLIAADIEGDTAGVMLELNCETDFVAKTEPFQALAARVATIAGTSKVADPAELLTVEDDGTSVQAILDEANAVMGEKVEVRRFVRYAADNAADGTPGYVATYLHRTSPDLPPTVGVLVELDRPDAEVAKDIAQHIAAFMPSYLDRESIPEDVLANERRIAEATSREEGKPEQALPRIVEGRVNGFVKESALLEQGFVKEPKKPVKNVLAEAGVAVRRFTRFRVGQ
ncbi:MAG: translation elongation factor Ts [Mycobacteriales bacterium]